MSMLKDKYISVHKHYWNHENLFRPMFEGPTRGGGERLWCSWWSRWRELTTPYLASLPPACEGPGGQRWCTGCRGPGRSPAVHGRRRHSGFVSHRCRAWAAGSGVDLLPPGATWWARLWRAPWRSQGGRRNSHRRVAGAMKGWGNIKNYLCMSENFLGIKS